MSHVMRPALALAVALLPLSLATTHAQNAFYTTGTYTIDTANSVNNRAFVGRDSSLSKTDSMGNPYNPTVNMVTGGSVGDYLFAYNSSTTNITGGSISTFLASYDTSTLTISGGSIGKTLGAYNNSTVTISGGSIGTGLEANDNSTVTISGGSFSIGLAAYNNSTVIISGGTFGQRFFYDYTGGGFTLVGYNLLASYANYDGDSGTKFYDLSGTLQDGTDLSGYVLGVYPRSTFTLQSTSTAVPEPGSIALLIGLSMTGAGFLARRRKQVRLEA